VEGTSSETNVQSAKADSAQEKSDSKVEESNGMSSAESVAPKTADAQPAGTQPAGKVNPQSSDTKTSERIPKKTGPVKTDLTPREPVEINLRTLLQAGVHFGHQTARWNPAMSEYLYGSRNGIHIVNLPKTMESWQEARKAIVEITSRGGSVLFVGTKKQAQDPIVEEARRCGSFYVAKRWLGGMITNFQTIRKSISRLNKLEEILAEEDKQRQEGAGSKFTKKERLMMSREREKLEFSLGGIRDMYAAPQLMFIIDIKREDIAVKEAQRLDIPVVALVDTNCDPKEVTHPIPSNDDGTRAIRLFASAVCDAVLEGKKIYAQRGAKRDEVKVDSAKSTPSKKTPKVKAKKEKGAVVVEKKLAEKKPAGKKAARVEEKTAAVEKKAEEVESKKVESQITEKAVSETDKPATDEAKS
jgi:small subunit ribosomal protein S2